MKNKGVPLTSIEGTGHIHNFDGVCHKHYEPMGAFCTKCFGQLCPKCPPPSHKVVTVEALFPEAKGQAFRAAKGEASNWPLAAYRALKKIAKTKGIKGKHLTTAHITLSIGTVIEEKTNGKA